MLGLLGSVALVAVVELARPPAPTTELVVWLVAGEYAEGEIDGRLGHLSALSAAPFDRLRTMTVLRRHALPVEEGAHVDLETDGRRFEVVVDGGTRDAASIRIGCERADADGLVFAGPWNLAPGHNVVLALGPPPRIIIVIVEAPPS